jgi:2-succinyl-5-enolpyruvyl-6-hydroxy-3-cyclohexene-1-carboxylate synthase
VSVAHILSAPNVNALWAGLLVEELVRQGVGLFVIAPGSRSAPLALAVASNGRAKYVVHVDERGCAFVALGHARATGRPAAVVTTSGTAVANTLPAVVEADHDGVPLLLLTADRPPELRETGANQAVRQAGLFAGSVRWAFDVPTPSLDVDPAFVLTTAAQAVHRAQSPPGPVHLNLMFREPLGPTSDGLDAPGRLAKLQDWLENGSPYTAYSTPGAASVAGDYESLAAIERGIVIAGKSDDPATARAALGLGEALGWPVIPDVGSGLRVGGSARVVHHVDAALASARLSALRPEAVIHLGGPAVSKRLSTWLSAARPREMVVVRRGPSRFDPSHIATRRIEADPGEWASAVASARSSQKGHSEWKDLWLAASAAASEAIEAALDDGLTEPVAARVTAAAVPAGGALVLGSSMPIRDVDAFAGKDGPALRVAANRGASGIDGTVATAAGFALGTGRPTALLLGDLALLHDLNALDLLKREDMPPVAIVVVNNDGGGIFSFLPVAGVPGVPFEELFGTPHGLDFEHAAAMFGLAYATPRSGTELRGKLADVFTSGRPALLEVRTERGANRTLHAELLDRVGAAVDDALARLS